MGKTAEEILDKYLDGFRWPHWSKENAIKAMQEFAGQQRAWQLCPKCNGDGHLGRYNSPNFSNTATPICDICIGNKIIKTPPNS